METQKLIEDFITYFKEEQRPLPDPTRYESPVPSIPVKKEEPQKIEIQEKKLFIPPSVDPVVFQEKKAQLDPYPFVIFLETKGSSELPLIRKIMLAVSSSVTSATLIEVQENLEEYLQLPQPHLFIARKSLLLQSEVHKITQSSYSYYLGLQETYTTNEEKKTLWQLLKTLPSYMPK